MGPGHPRIKHLMSQLSPLVSRSMLVRLAPNLGCYSPGISSPKARPVVPDLAPLEPAIPAFTRDISQNPDHIEVGHGTAPSAPKTRFRALHTARSLPRDTRGRNRAQ